KAVRQDGLHRVTAELRSRRADGREVVHSRAEVLLAADLPRGGPAQPEPSLPPYPLDPDDVYQPVLFHRPELRGPGAGARRRAGGHGRDGTGGTGPVGLAAAAAARPVARRPAGARLCLPGAERVVPRGARGGVAAQRPGALPPVPAPLPGRGGAGRLPRGRGAGPDRAGGRRVRGRRRATGRSHRRLRVRAGRRPERRLPPQPAGEGGDLTVTELSSSPYRIAVVGAGALLPGAADAEQFWANILNRVDASRDVPPGRWLLDPDAAYAP